MPVLFLSHAAADVDLAEFLDVQLARSPTGLTIFRTSRVGQIPSGRDWFNFVTTSLRDADQYLVLLTPTSHSRPWVLFETGAAWYSKRPVVLALAGGLAAGSVPEPLRNLQVLSLEDEAQAAQIFADVGASLAEPAQFCSRVRSLADAGRVEALRREGWRQITFEGRTYAWDGPFERLPEATPRPVPDGLIKALESNGLYCQFGIPDRLWNEYGQGLTLLYDIDEFMRRHQLLASFGQVLLVRETAA